MTDDRTRERTRAFGRHDRASAVLTRLFAAMRMRPPLATTKIGERACLFVCVLLMRLRFTIAAATAATTIQERIDDSG